MVVILNKHDTIFSNLRALHNIASAATDIAWGTIVKPVSKRHCPLHLTPTLSQGTFTHYD